MKSILLIVLAAFFTGCVSTSKDITERNPSQVTADFGKQAEVISFQSVAKADQHKHISRYIIYNERQDLKFLKSLYNDNYRMYKRNTDFKLEYQNAFESFKKTAIESASKRKELLTTTEYPVLISTDGEYQQNANYETTLKSNITGKEVLLIKSRCENGYMESKGPAKTATPGGSYIEAWSGVECFVVDLIKIN